MRLAALCHLYPATSCIPLRLQLRPEFSTEHLQADQAYAQTEHCRDSVRHGQRAQKPTNLSAREILRMNIEVCLVLGPKPERERPPQAPAFRHWP